MAFLLFSCKRLCTVVFGIRARCGISIVLLQTSLYCGFRDMNTLWHFYCSPINVFVLWLSGYEHVVAFLLFSCKRLCTVVFGIRARCGISIVLLQTSLYCGFRDMNTLWHFYCSPINIFVLWLSGYEHVVAFLLFSCKRLCTVVFGIRARCGISIVLL